MPDSNPTAVRGPRLPKAVPVLGWLAGLALVAHICAVGNVVGSDAPEALEKGLFAGIFVASAAICAIRGARGRGDGGPWIAFAIATGLSTAAWLLYWLYVEQLDPIPYPSISDAPWLAGYVAYYVGLLLFMRTRLRSFSRSLWLDGLIGALSLAAVSTAVVFQPVLDATGGGSSAGVAVNLAYPLADLVMLSMIVTMLALSGWRPDRPLALLGAAFTVMVVADSVYLYRSAAGDYVPGTLLDAAWPLTMCLIAWAAWARPADSRSEEAGDSWRGYMAPGLFAALALGVLVYGNVAGIPLLAALFATATLLAISVRGALRFREIRQLNRRNEALRGAALSDSLTGLCNHRAFHEDLAAIVSERAQVTLVMLDLVGLKLTNDTLGHQAGDGRLTAFSRGLVSLLRRGDEAYRVGGDEFAVILRGATAWSGFAFSERLQTVVAGGYMRSAPAVSAGVAQLAPGMRKDGLIRAADLALIEAKVSARKAVIYTDALERPAVEGDPDERDRHTKTLATSLARAVDAKDSYTRSHCETVAETCVLIAEQLGLGPKRSARLRLAGLLHDVGKIGIPDAILQKPGPLDEEEFEVMRTHSALGRDIVLAAGLEEEATWILHHHERVDGRGYPTGLAADELPLESRIIFVADAFEAMTSDRPYRKGGSAEAAIAELRECSGTQFDPVCVQALEAAVGQAKRRPEVVTPA